MRFQCPGKFCSTAMVLIGRSRKSVYPSVLPLRSYSSLNLQQVASCDFYLYSLPGNSSSKPQTTGQKSNHCLKRTRHSIIGTGTRQQRRAHSQQILYPSFWKAKKKNTWWRDLCSFYILLPSLPFFPSVCWILQDPQSDLEVMLVLWHCCWNALL